VAAPTQPSCEELVYGWSDYRSRFGSAHAAGCNMGFCDGSVHLISFDIDENIHRYLCDRQDGKVFGSEDY
jgi:prepilin-type processing-associated H-X9-DG protein